MRCPRCGFVIEVAVEASTVEDPEVRELLEEIALERAEDDALFLHDCGEEE